MALPKKGLAVDAPNATEGSNQTRMHMHQLSIRTRYPCTCTMENEHLKRLVWNLHVEGPVLHKHIRARTCVQLQFLVLGGGVRARELGPDLALLAQNLQ